MTLTFHPTLNETAKLELVRVMTLLLAWRRRWRR